MERATRVQRAHARFHDPILIASPVPSFLIQSFWSTPESHGDSAVVSLQRCFQWLRSSGSPPPGSAGEPRPCSPSSSKFSLGRSRRAPLSDCVLVLAPDCVGLRCSGNRPPPPLLSSPGGWLQEDTGYQGGRRRYRRRTAVLPPCGAVPPEAVLPWGTTALPLSAHRCQRRAAMAGSITIFALIFVSFFFLVQIFRSL